MPIFRVKSVKIYTGQKKITWIDSWRSWQISGMLVSSPKINHMLTSSYKECSGLLPIGCLSSLFRTAVVHWHVYILTNLLFKHFPVDVCVYWSNTSIWNIHGAKWAMFFAHHLLDWCAHFIFTISEKHFSISPLHQDLSASEYAGALSCCLMIWRTICNVFCTWSHCIIAISERQFLSYHSTPRVVC